MSGKLASGERIRTLQRILHIEYPPINVVICVIRIDKKKL